MIFIYHLFIYLHKHYNSNTTKIMENTVKTNTLTDNGSKITLRGYYKSLPRSVSPKKELLEKITERCGVTLATARNWVKYGIHPLNHEHCITLSELTGIPESDLFD